MFNLGFTEVLFLAVIALIFVGPKQLPELARTVGRLINELKRTTGEIGSSLSSPTRYVKDQLDKEVNDVKKAIYESPKSETEVKADVEELEEDKALHEAVARTDHPQIAEQPDTSTENTGESDEFKSNS